MCRWAAALVARRAVPRNIKSRLDPPPVFYHNLTGRSRPNGQDSCKRRVLSLATTYARARGTSGVLTGTTRPHSLELFGLEHPARRALQGTSGGRAPVAINALIELASALLQLCWSIDRTIHMEG